jgi:LmbE family N-acetylglucosaminyl deacetylase
MVVRMALKALCVVAHPDDCIIFAWPFIERFSEFDWTVLYLTYNEQDDRAQEVKKFWQKRNVATQFLGNVDTYLDMENNKLSFDAEKAYRDIKQFAQNYDLLLTHDSMGDYGHIHHKFVHECVVAVNKPKLFFATAQDANFECERTEHLDLAEIPLHADVVSGFQDANIGRYSISVDVMQYINERLN